MNLLLQLNADLQDRFPSHERRLYLWACRKKACRRKEGSIRGFRAVRSDKSQAVAAAAPAEPAKDGAASAASTKPAVNLGETLFGVKSPSASQANPFSASSSSTGAASANPFAASSSSASTPAQKPLSPEPLAESFAQKAQISTPSQPQKSKESSQLPNEPWPQQSAFPQPFPSYYVDADTEYLDTAPEAIPANARLERGEGEGSNSVADDKLAFESSMDKAFQRFADRLSQNPEQVLRYEFDGQPLLYSKKDSVGKMLAPAQDDGGKVQVAQRANGSSSNSRIPKCANCGAARVFELQLTPHAITELEAEDLSVEGMDWGTIIMGACSADCQPAGKADKELGYVEEWVGVQWEEIASTRR